MDNENLEKNKKSPWKLVGGILGGIVAIGMLVFAILMAQGETGSESSDGSENSSDSNSETSYLAGSSITKAGTYELSGDYECISINTSGVVELVLNSANISCEAGPAIYVEDAKEVDIVLKGENTLSATTTEDLEGALHSTDDLVFSGDGSLTVEGNYDGIVSKDTLTINGGTYTVNTGDDCIKGKDNVVITAGTFNLTSSSGDGIKSTNDEDASLGYIEISGGTFTINVGQDGIQSETYTTISGGEITITAGDDGIHAVTVAKIDGGNLNITAHEGIEGTQVGINDGTIYISASDDGINAANKSSAYAVLIEVNGGYTTIKMGAGDTDAVDSNGDIYVNGGTLDITAQSPFDYEGTAKYTGGTIIVNGVTVNTITNQFMGGDMGGGAGGNTNTGGNSNNNNSNMQPSQNSQGQGGQAPSGNNRGGR